MQNSSNIVETSIAFLEIKEGVMHIILKQDADLDVEHIDEMIDQRRIMQNGEPLLVLADIRKLWLASKKARERAAQKDMTDLNVAMAIVTGSLTSRMLANFFIKFNRPSSPTRMFSSTEEALVWLSEKHVMNNACLKLNGRVPRLST